MYLNQHLLYGTTLKNLSIGEFFINSLTIFINSIREAMTTSTYIMYSIFAMFIFSEIIAFSSFIWGYLHLRLSNPASLAEINLEAYLQISDVLNSGSILVSVIQNNIQEDYNDETEVLQESLVLISFIFLSLQNDEYSLLTVHLNNNWITSYFYILTGLHSLHVCIGSIFIFIQSLFYDNIGQLRDEDFNSGIYWHFVEIIWIGLTSLLFLI